MIADSARSMRDENIRKARKELLHLPHIFPLTEYVNELRSLNRGEVPYFDPLDGGVNAEVLFLLEKPGPMTSETKKGKKGSNFISRDNDDSTAEAIFNFMRQANIPRERTVIWNFIPWWNETRKINAEERQNAAQCIEGLIKLLPTLKSIVMVGGSAAKVEKYLKGTNLILFKSHHPSPIVRSTNPEKWRSIPNEWTKILSSFS